MLSCRAATTRMRRSRCRSASFFWATRPRTDPLRPELGVVRATVSRKGTRERPPPGAVPASPSCEFPYRFTSFRSFAGSPEGLFASAVQLPPAVNTRELLEMLHWSIVASASMLPCAVATKLGVGGAVTPAALAHAVAEYVCEKVLPYLNVSCRQAMGAALS